MKLQNALGRNRFGGVIGAVFAVLLGSWLGLALYNPRFHAGQAVVNRSYDLLYLPRPYITPDEVRMIYLDDDSHRAMNQSDREPWDRAIHAKLLDHLKAEGVKAVTFDIVFSDPGRDSNADKSFANALENSGKVVLAADSILADVGRSEVDARSITMPNALFRGGTNVAVGTAEVAPDDDLILRKHLRISPDDQVSGLSWTTAEILGAEVTRKEKPYERERWINYYGPPLTLPNVSYFRVLLPQGDPEGLPAGYFSNKVVFVGAHIFTKFAGDRKDEYSTPYSYWLSKSRFIPGVEAQATIFLNLLRGDWLSRLPLELWWLVLLGGIFGYGLAQLRPLPAVGAAILAAILIAGVSYYLFSAHHLLFAWLILVGVQIPIALLWSVVFNSVQLYVQNRLFEESLRMYLSPKLVKKFASDKDLLRVGAKKQLLTVLFSDIAGFTSISEGMDSDELAREMNKYFESAVAGCIHATDGTIVKYIGDAIFAFWNAPDDQIDHAMRAAESALRFRDQPPQIVNGKQLITRIGLHTGVANVGNFGSTTRVDYTAIGENINLASRMESLNKYLGTEVLITADTQEGIAGRLVTRFLGQFQLKGFEKAVGVYELVGQLEKEEACRPVHEAFAQAVKLFRQKDIAGAETAFRRVLEISPNDGPTKFYLKFISELHDHPLPADWTGEVELKEK